MGRIGQRLSCLALILSLQVGAVDGANALLKGNPRSDMPRSPEAALRRAVPPVNAQMIDTQSDLEEVAFQLRIPQRKQWDRIEKAVQACRLRLIDEQAKIFADVPGKSRKDVTGFISRLDNALAKMEKGILYKDSSYTATYLNAALDAVSRIELTQATGLPYSIPRDFANRPVLAGRASVRVTFHKADRSFTNVDTAEKSPKAEVVIDLDGFSAPVSSGQFLVNVMRGEYDGVKVTNDLSAIVLNLGQKGSSDGDGSLPLEIMQRGEFEPKYNAPLDLLEDEYPVLPLSIYGAVALAHPAENVNGSSDKDFFIYKFERGMGGLSGLSFDEGQFSVVGYVTQGADFIDQVETGDTIEKVVVISGADRLKQQQQQQQQQQQDPV